MTDQTIIEQDLLPCPFCASTDAFTERADLSSSYVVCNNCLARGPVECQDSDDEDEPGQASAIRSWNTRATLAKVTKP
jgi:Lar family restriction alleviation protein